ncbi:MAG: hypothetical protein AAGH78_10405 [Cyanobacteria bacterium P01_H01_bin.58]
MTKASLHCIARLPQRFLIALGISLGMLTAGALAPPPSAQEEVPLPVTQTVVPSYGAFSQTLATTNVLWDAAATTAPQMLDVTLYTLDDTCNGFVTKPKAIASDKAIPQIVHFLLTDQTPNLLDFELAGYRIYPTAKGNSLTIDFRRTANAKRQFISLSICEQLVLFGSLRKTLLENANLNIDNVYFSERGRLIEL